MEPPGEIRACDVSDLPRAWHQEIMVSRFHAGTLGSARQKPLPDCHHVRLPHLSQFQGVAKQAEGPSSPVSDWTGPAII